MDLVTVRELYKNPEKFLDKEITVGGWIRSLRDSKAFGFIVISDGTYFETLLAGFQGLWNDRSGIMGFYVP